MLTEMRNLRNDWVEVPHLIRHLPRDLIGSHRMFIRLHPTNITKQQSTTNSFRAVRDCPVSQYQIYDRNKSLQLSPPPWGTITVTVTPLMRYSMLQRITAANINYTVVKQRVANLKIQWACVTLTLTSSPKMADGRNGNIILIYRVI